jgi:hypothetical protein
MCGREVSGFCYFAPLFDIFDIAIKEGSKHWLNSKNEARRQYPLNEL